MTQGVETECIKPQQENLNGKGKEVNNKYVLYSGLLEITRGASTVTIQINGQKTEALVDTG